MIIIEPNYQPAPPSNQSDDEDENEFGLSDREILKQLHNDLLEAIPTVLSAYSWFHGEDAWTTNAEDRLRECYTAYMKLSAKLEEM